MRRGPAHKCLLDLRHARRRRLIEQFGGFDHHSVLTEPAQRHLLVDPRLLYRMQSIFGFGARETFVCTPTRSQTFECCDFPTADTTYRHHAGPDFFAVHQYRTRAALRKPTAELWSAQP